MSPGSRRWKEKVAMDRKLREFMGKKANDNTPRRSKKK